MKEQMITAREAAVLLCGWPNYSLVKWHVRAGRLRQMRKSERKRLYYRSEVENLRQNERAK